MSPAAGQYYPMRISDDIADDAPRQLKPPI